jgi:Flp pilus assembly protein protease CpaA
MSLSMQQKSDIATEVAKATPPVTVAGATVAGVQVNLWATLVYIVLQIGFLLYRWGRMHFGKGDE